MSSLRLGVHGWDILSKIDNSVFDEVQMIGCVPSCSLTLLHTLMLMDADWVSRQASRPRSKPSSWGVESKAKSKGAVHGGSVSAFGLLYLTFTP